MPHELISVIGKGGRLEETDVRYATARDLGRVVGRKFPIVCGGLGGVMEAVCRGCSEADGTSIGILPEVDRKANQYCTETIPTNLGGHNNPRIQQPEISRNLFVVAIGICVFAIGGGDGTANELKLAKRLGKRVFGLCGPPEPEGHNGPSIWNAGNNGFTCYEHLIDCLNESAAYLAQRFPGFQWQ